MEVAFEIGPFRVAWYGIMISLGVIAAVVVASWEAKRRGESVDHLLNMLLLVLPLGIVGARLYHVVDQWQEVYSRDPMLIFGGRGLGIYGAVIGGFVGLLIYTKWKKLSTLRWLDICAPGLIMAQAIGRWGNFFNQELYGYPSDLPWAIRIEPEHRLPQFATFERFHPLFLYESLWNLAGFAFLMLAARKMRRQLLAGEIFALYVVWYGIGRLILEGFKPEVWRLAGIPTAQWIAAIAIVVTVAIAVMRRFRRPTATGFNGGTESQTPGDQSS